MHNRNSTKDLISDDQPQFGGYLSARRANSECRRKKPKFSDLGVLKRNQDWLKAKERKLIVEREKKKYHEFDGCTFEPHINKFKLRTSENIFTPRSNSLNISYSTKSNRSYSEIHRNRAIKPSYSNQSYRSSKPNDTVLSDTLKTSGLSREIRPQEFSNYNTVSLDPILKDINLDTVHNR
jgi:hypothetical protein